MNNKDKRYLVGLETRIDVLEAKLEGMIDGAQTMPTITCIQCGVYSSDGYVCSVKDCCQGLNPMDDEDGD